MRLLCAGWNLRNPIELNAVRHVEHAVRFDNDGDHALMESASHNVGPSQVGALNINCIQS